MRGKGFGKYKRLAEREGRTGGVGEGRESVGGSPLPRYAPPIQNQSRLFSGLGVGEEELLPADLVVGDRLLPLGRNEPVDELLAEFLLDVRMLGRVHQNHAVLVEQALVAFDQDGQIGAVLEVEPGAAVGEHVAAAYELRAIAAGGGLVRSSTGLELLTEELPPLPEEPPVQQAGMLPWDEPAAQAAQPAAPVPAELEPVPQPEPPKPVPTPAAKPVPEKPQDAGQEGTALYPYWPQVVQQLQEKDPMLYTYLRKSKAYFDGTRVLIDGGKTFRDFIRANKDSQRLIKKLIKDVSGTAVPIGPYEPKSAGKTVSNAEQSLRALEKLGLDVSIEDSARKTRS